MEDKKRNIDTKSKLPVYGEKIKEKQNATYANQFFKDIRDAHEESFLELMSSKNTEFFDYSTISCDLSIKSNFF